MMLHLLLAGAFFSSAQAKAATLSGVNLVDSLSAGTDNVSVLRFLGANVTADKVDEERAPLLSSGTLADHFRWIDEKKPPAEVFKELGLQDLRNTRVQDSKIQAWLQYTKTVLTDAVSDKSMELLSPYETHMHLALVRRWRPSFKIRAEEVLHLQMEGWLAREYTPVKMFAFLMKGKDVDNFMAAGMNLLTWTKYLDAFNTKFPSRKMDEIDVLRAHFEDGDEDIFWALESGKKYPDMKGLATEWQNKQIESWVENSAVFRPRIVFQILKLDIADLDNLLTSPYMRIWTQYMASISKEGVMIEEFLSFFKVPLLNKVLEEAKGEKKTKKLATKLQEQLLATWMEEAKYSGRLVFVKLHLDYERDPLLHPNLKLWFRYLEWFRQKKSGNLASLAITSFDNDAHMEKVLIAAMKDSSFNDMAYKLLMAAIKVPETTIMASKVLVASMKDPKSTNMAFKVLMSAMKNPEATDMVLKVLVAAMKDAETTDLASKLVLAAMKDPIAVYMATKVLVAAKNDPETTDMAFELLMTVMENP